MTFYSEKILGLWEVLTTLCQVVYEGKEKSSFYPGKINFTFPTKTHLFVSLWKTFSLLHQNSKIHPALIMKSYFSLCQPRKPPKVLPIKSILICPFLLSLSLPEVLAWQQWALGRPADCPNGPSTQGQLPAPFKKSNRKGKKTRWLRHKPFQSANEGRNPFLKSAISKLSNHSSWWLRKKIIVQRNRRDQKTSHEILEWRREIGDTNFPATSESISASEWKKFQGSLQNNWDCVKANFSAKLSVESGILDYWLTFSLSDLNGWNTIAKKDWPEKGKFNFKCQRLNFQFFHQDIFFFLCQDCDGIKEGRRNANSVSELVTNVFLIFRVTFG